MPLTVAIIGSNGQIGQDLLREFSTKNYEVVGLTHAQIEIEDLRSTREALEAINPDLVINTAAFHNVSSCESDPEKARSVNEIGANNVALVSDGLGAKVVFISTDYVFDGRLPFGDSYSPNASTNPLNAYGRSKRGGEVAVLNYSPNLVYRISSVFGQAGSSGKGGNFIEAIIRKITSGETAMVVDDNRMSPTYALTTSRILHQLLVNDATGIHHGSSVGQISWFDLAAFVAKQLGREGQVIAIEGAADSIPSRPMNSSLDTTLLQDFGIENEHWTDSVLKYLSEKGYIY